MRPINLKYADDTDLKAGKAAIRKNKQITIISKLNKPGLPSQG